MNSDTPRTDESIIEFDDATFVESSVARQLEREVSDLKKQLADNLAALQKEHERYIALSSAVYGEGGRFVMTAELVRIAEEQRELAEMFRVENHK